MKSVIIVYRGGKEDADKAIAKYRQEHPDHRGNVIAIPEDKHDNE